MTMKRLNRWQNGLGDRHSITDLSFTYQTDESSKVQNVLTQENGYSVLLLNISVYTRTIMFKVA